jgi:NADH-quinone oxidoreductase subunit J
MEISAVLFYIFSVLILLAAIRMVISTNLVHSALYMVAAFVGVACIFLLLYADFLALVQILVYVGAISILIVFGVMLTRRGDMKDSNLFGGLKIAGGVVSIALFVVIARLFIMTNWVAANPVQTTGTAGKISDLLLRNYAVPFEAAGMLLLVAMIGAIMIGKGVGDRR